MNVFLLTKLSTGKKKRGNIRPCNHSNKQGVYVRPASLNYPLKPAERGIEEWAGHCRLMDR